MTTQEAEELFKQLVQTLNGIRLTTDKAIKQKTTEYFEDLLEQSIAYASPEMNGFCALIAEYATLTETWIAKNPRFCNYARQIIEKTGEKSTDMLSFCQTMRLEILKELLSDEQKKKRKPRKNCRLCQGTGFDTGDPIDIENNGGNPVYQSKMDCICTTR